MSREVVFSRGFYDVWPSEMSLGSRQCFFIKIDESVTDKPAPADEYACLTPSRPAGRERAVFLIGDSHATALVPGFTAGIAGAAELVWAAVPHPRPWTYEDPGGFYDSARRALDEHLREGDVVVWSVVATIFSRGADLIDARNATLLLLGDLPMLPLAGHAGGVHLLDRCMPTRENPGADDLCWMRRSDVYERGLGNIAPTLQELADAHARTSYLALTDHLCVGAGDDATCGAPLPIGQPAPVAFANTAGYADNNHLSQAGSLALWPLLCRTMRDHAMLP